MRVAVLVCCFAALLALVVCPPCLQTGTWESDMGKGNKQIVSKTPLTL